MNYIDLFAGCGGLSLGLHKAGLNGLFAVEKNNDAFDTLQFNLIERLNHFDWPEWLEKKNWDINKLINVHSKELKSLKGHVDLVVGGPPCQGFSMAGKRDNNDIRNQLMHSYIQFIRLVKPNYLFFENVHGFTVPFKEDNNTKGIPYSVILIENLKKMGYKVDSTIVNMSDFGVPQKRERFILVACKDHNPVSFFNALSDNRDKFLEKRKIKNPVCIKQAIGDLQRRYGEDVSIDKKGFQNGKYGPKNTNFQKLMRKNVKSKAIPDSHRFANHHKETIELFQEIMSLDKKGVRITPKMNLVEGLKKRGVTALLPTSICPTITSIPDDFIHFSEPRIMTVREHARIQSFPDDYHFKGKYTTGGDRRKFEVPRYTQVANAVPPLFAEQVGLALNKISNE